MKPWLIVSLVLVATGVTSGVFWLVMMPRLARKALKPLPAILLLVVFAVVLIGIPAAGLLALRSRDPVLIGALIVGWAVAVRGAGWVMARKYFVPRLRSMPPGDESPPPNEPAPKE